MARIPITLTIAAEGRASYQSPKAFAGYRSRLVVDYEQTKFLIGSWHRPRSSPTGQKLWAIGIIGGRTRPTDRPLENVVHGVSSNVAASANVCCFVHSLALAATKNSGAVGGRFRG